MEVRAASQDARSARLMAHCAEAVQLAAADPGYRAAVLERLRTEGAPPAEDLWTAIPWVWRLVLDRDVRVPGKLDREVAAAAGVLREALLVCGTVSDLDSRWTAATGGALALGSTLRSHPFADLRAWSIRKQFLG
jgi:hypothetical protein